MMQDIKGEEDRLAALRGYGVLDTSPETDFDQVVRLAARLLDVPTALVSLVDQDRQWFKATIGLDGVRETPRDIAFCDHAIRGQGVMVVPDATEDPRFAENPLVTGEPGIRFYAGAPLITPDGHALGTLCVIDQRPHEGLPERDAQILTELAGFVRDKLELRREAQRSKALAEQAALTARLMSAAAEAPDFAGAIHAAAEAIADATGGLFCHVWRLAADGGRAIFVSGAGRGVLGEEAYFDRLRAMVLTPANSQVAAALVQDVQNWSPMSPGPETAARPAASLAGEQGVTLQLATPFGFGEERYVFSVGLAAPPEQPEVMASLMREATAALRPMLRRHMDEADGRLFRRMIQASAHGVLVSEPPFEEPGPHIIFANAAFEAMTGYRLAEIKGRSPRFLYGPETDMEASRRIRAEVVAGRSVAEEMVHYRQDGTPFWTSVRVTPVLDSAGAVTHYISSQTDITQAHQARLERDALTRDLQALVAAIPGVLMRHRQREDGKWTRSFIAPGVEALTGFTVEEAFASGWWGSNINETDKQMLYAALEDAQAGGQSRSDFRFRRKDGVWIWIRILLRGHVGPDGGREVIGIWSDVSEEYHRLEAHQARARELETVIATIPGVLIRTCREPDGSWKRILVSPNVTELTGHSVEDAMAEDWWSANADPASVDRANVFFKSENVMAPWEGEFRFRHKLGHWIWIRRRSRGYVDEHGVVELVSIWNDVSEEHRLTAEREAKTRELATVIDTVPGGLIRNRRQADGSWKRIQVSPGITEVTGHSVAEALEDDWLDGLRPTDLAQRVAAFFRGKDWYFPMEHEFLFQHKLGHLIWIRRRSHMYQDENGVEESVSVWNNITDQKNLLLEREKLTADLQHVIATMPGVLMRIHKNEEGRWVRHFISPSIEALTGFTVEEAQRPDWLPNNLDPADRASMLALLAEGDPLAPVTTYFRFRHKQGHTIWINRNTSGYVDAAGKVEVISIWNDITAERNLALERERLAADLQRVITTMPGVLIHAQKDAGGRWVRRFISPAIEALTGFTVEEAHAADWWSNGIDPQDRDRMMAMMYQGDLSKPTATDFRFRHKQGHTIWIHRNTSGFLGLDGQPEAISIWNDITAEKRLLLDQEAMANDLQRVINTMPGILVRLRQDSGGNWVCHFISPAIEALTGFTVAETKRPNWWLDNLDPSEKERLPDLLYQSDMAEQKPITFHFRHKQGHSIWINRTTSAFRDADGQPEVISVWSDITAERRLLMDREELANDLEAVIKVMPGGLMRSRLRRDQTWLRYFVSAGMEAMTGYTIAELVQSDWARAPVHPDDRPALEVSLKSEAAGLPTTLEFRLRHKLGHYIWINRRTSSFTNAEGEVELVAIWTDVTAERQLLADRDELASDLQAVMDAMPGVLMRIREMGDGSWNRAYVGPGIEEVTGHSVDEALRPEWVEENLDPAEQGLLNAQVRGQFSEHQFSLEFRFRHKKGHWIWIRRIARGHMDPDGTREVIAIWNDVTREKSLAEQFAQSAKLAQLGEVATGMAHELNQPLAGISLAAENALRSLARLPEPPQRAQEKLTLIVDLTKRASDIIDHMRIFGRSETASRGAVSLAEVVKGAGQLLASKLNGGGVRLQAALPEDLPPVLGKAVPLEQVIMNLISNACDAYSGLPEPVPSERRVIGVSAHAEADWVTIEVQDAAGGIPEEVLPRIFEPFFTTKRVGEGTGLGLSISYGIISDMGGTITAENHSGGCRMRILLPVAR